MQKIDLNELRKLWHSGAKQQDIADIIGMPRTTLRAVIRDYPESFPPRRRVSRYIIVDSALSSQSSRTPVTRNYGSPRKNVLEVGKEVQRAFRQSL